MILALMLVACILFFLASFNIPTGPYVNLLPLGLFFAALSLVWGKF